MNADYPILEFDESREAVIEPHKVLHAADVPLHCVFCFFQEVIARLRDDGRARLVTNLTSEMGLHPLYETDVGGRRVAAFHSGVGAPLAAAQLEELIALGCRKFMVCGGAGVLDRDIAVGHVVVPSAAVRDEGTSYHYLPPAREVQAHPAALAAIEGVLRAWGVPYAVGKTWTTDAFYRETRARADRRRAEGCLTVEMEAAALLAVAQFRGVPLGVMLYGGDDVSGPEWDHRGWQGRPGTREQLFYLAAEACLAL